MTRTATGTRRRRRSSGVLATALALAACTTGAPPDAWQKPDGSAPSLTETSDCRVQAGRYAAARYPDQVQRVIPDGGTYRISNPDRFTAEIGFYESCLRSKGYARPS
jgi:hypothetical protein